MRIASLQVLNFRNLETQTIELQDGANIIYGGNAQGKTNLLEAIYIFGSGRPLRPVRDVGMIKRGTPYALVEVEFIAGGRKQNGQIRIEEGRRKQIKINGINMTRAVDLCGRFHVVFFGPEELGLVKAGPESRRRFIDEALCPLKPNFAGMLINYNHALKQKNNLLRAIKEKPSLEATLDEWNERLCEYGAAVTWYREAFMNRIKAAAGRIHSEIAGGERAEIEYAPSVKECDYNDVLSIREAFYSRVKHLRSAEINSGAALVGPHRDDIEIKIDGVSARVYGSQGQQRTAALSLKVAQMELVHDNIGEYPILLLDDVMSELDGRRREYLVKWVKNKQVFITCTDRMDMDGRAKWYRMEAGGVNEV